MDKWADDGCTDGRTDGKIMFLLHIHTMRGNDVASLVEFHPVV